LGGFQRHTRLDRQGHIDRVEIAHAIQAAVDRTSSDPSSFGTAPPTIEVLPPWATIGTPAPAHRRTTSATSPVLAGRTTALVLPL